ncbi:bacteriophage f237 ORF9 [Vibrio cholerae]|nr:bacteriophage f237 ORF9 [Vibrio cholerae]
MKYHEMTKNYIFREVECGLSVEQAAEPCLKTVRTVKDWDKGKTITYHMLRRGAGGCQLLRASLVD